MKEKIREYAERLLSEGHVKGFLALIRNGSDVSPHLFTSPADLEALSLGDEGSPGTERYPLVKVLERLLVRYPLDNFAVLARGCDERAFQKLVSNGRLNPNRVVLVGFSCPEVLAERCGCLKPHPEDLVAGSKTGGPANGKVVSATSRNFIKDLQFLKEVSERCMKCFGCRNVCPVCNCKECTLEEDTFIPKASLPPANPEFLLTRAMHMVGYCVYCGLCEEACPADIPLKTIYKMVANIANEQYGYQMQEFAPRGDSSAEGLEEERAVSQAYRETDMESTDRRGKKVPSRDLGF